MIRHEGENICVRYNGTETRVTIERGSGNGLTIAELEALVAVLGDALVERKAFMQGVSTPGRCGKCKRLVKSRSTGNVKYCKRCYVEEFGEEQSDVCSHGNDPNHVPCDACAAYHAAKDRESREREGARR